MNSPNLKAVKVEHPLAAPKQTLSAALYHHRVDRDFDVNEPWNKQKRREWVEPLQPRPRLPLKPMNPFGAKPDTLLPEDFDDLDKAQRIFDFTKLYQEIEKAKSEKVEPTPAKKSILPKSEATFKLDTQFFIASEVNAKAGEVKIKGCLNEVRNSDRLPDIGDLAEMMMLGEIPGCTFQSLLVKGVKNSFFMELTYTGEIPKRCTAHYPLPHHNQTCGLGLHTSDNRIVPIHQFEITLVTSNGYDADPIGEMRVTAADFNGLQLEACLLCLDSANKALDRETLFGRIICSTYLIESTVVKDKVKIKFDASWEPR